MKKQIMQYLSFVLTAVAVMALGGAARADINSNMSTTNVTAWPTEPNSIFYSSQPMATASFTADGTPTAATGALANSLGELVTISNTAGNLGGIAGPGAGTNYVLTGLAMLVSGYSTTVPCTLHIYDVTSNLTASSGNPLQVGSGSFTTAAPLPVGDLLGENQGLPFINAAASGAEHVLYLSLMNGPNTYGDEVVLASNHTYAIVVSVPTAAATGGAGSFNWFKSSTADPGGQAMGSVNALNPNQAYQTINALGQAGGAPRTFAVALYGYPATNGQAVSVNASTNVVATTNYFIDQFNALSVKPGNPYYTNAANPNGIDYSTNTTGTSQITSIWGQWFGVAANVSWDNTNDAQGNTNGGLGGSLLLQPLFAAGSQLEAFDGYNGITPTLNASTLGITSFECDVMFDASSAVQTNQAGLVYFGNLQFGHDLAGAQAYIGGVIVVPQTMSNQWVHVKIPLNPNDTTLTAIQDILIHIYGPYGAYPSAPAGDLIGQVKMWVDNIKFKAPAAVPLTPPPAVTIVKATPGTARFFGVSPQYTRSILATSDTAQSWIGSRSDDSSGTPFSLPVSYSMTLSHIASAANVATRIWLVDSDTGNYNGQDYSAASELWLNIAGAGTNGYTASVAWKAFLPGANPNNTALVVTNAVGVGTWTLTFTGWTNGNLMAPGWTTASNFTINVSTVSNTTTSDTGLRAFLEAFGYGTTLTALFGMEDDNSAAVGAYDDFTRISVTNVSGVNELDVFALDSAIDTTNQWAGNYNTGAPTGYYQITNAAANGGAGFTSAYPANLQTPVILVTTNTPFWITWNVTTNGYGLGESTNGLLPIKSLVSPASLSGYTDVQPQIVAGGTNWALIPRDCLPATNQAYFRVVNPPPKY
jgi:hypothetical protein